MASPKTGVAFADDPPADGGSSRPLLADDVYMPMDHSSSSPSRRPLLKDITNQNGSMGQASTDVEPEVEEFWDQFQSIPDDSEGADNCAKLFQFASKVFKVFLYGFFFLFVLAGLFFSRVALIAMATNVGKYEKILSNDSNASAAEHMTQSAAETNSTQKPMKLSNEILMQRDGWVYLLLFGVISPYIWTFVQSLAQVTFGNHPYPSIGSILYTVVMETLHSFGLSVFLWIVLPKLNLLEAFVIFSIVGVVPSILHILHKREGSNAKKIVVLAVDILACILQVAGLIILAVLIRQKYDIIWQPIVAGLLLSVPYIENFLSTQPYVSVGALQTVANALEVWKSNQRHSRAKQYLLASALKIGLMFGFAFALLDNLSAPQHVFKMLSNNFPEWNAVTLYAPLILFIVIPFLTFYFAYTSSQLMMQRVCYALPLVIHTPFGVVFSALIVKYAPDALRLHPQIVLPLGSMFDSLALVAVGLGACWLSQIWITRHLWFPSNLRLEFARNLFVLPNYCAVHLEQSLAYNRSRDDKVVRRAACCEKHAKEESETNPTENIPMIYVCATMWHENKNEMLQMLKSIFRLDEDQATKRNSSKILKEFGDGGVNPDYYEFEVHIMFDDAMKRSKGNEWTLNDFVVSFVKTINEAASSLYNTSIVIPAPIKIPTPYGGKLLYTLPGENKMVVHLKDKNKIRHRKRWSQIMYMYYLLGFKNLAEVNLSDDPKKSCNKQQSSAEIFQRMPESAIAKSENTFLLALDGDVDFKPQALQLLVDRLKKNRKVGVVCGRIHPIGAGPMVWYQKFEYAIGHWLQKAAEHVLGCVLCAPGCFSLFRGSAIMDDNVMKTYSIDATEARHYVQYDQGEDRWLSTLLLQRGYRVEYVAASDAFTYAPETFKEFFNQRRRWAPSTMANILDLLASWRQTVKRNSSISMLYILYQLFIFISSILGPATIILLIAGALEQVLKLDAGWSHVLALIPPVIYIILCFASAADTQIIVATIFSAIYSIIMIAVMIGSIISIFTDGLLTPSGVFLVVLSAVFILSAILHPQEFFDLIPGVLYYITIPSGYLLLTIYSMVNMNIVSWGTRETTKQAKVEKPTGFLHSLIDKQLQEDSLCNKLGAFLSQCCGSNKQLMEDNSKSLHMVLDKVDRLEREMLGKQGNTQVGITYAVPKAQERRPGGNDSAAEDEPVRRNDLVNPAWMEERCLRHSPSLSIDESEQEFWDKLIERYLKPIEHDAAREAHIADQLKQMRNNVCFAFFMINALWIAVIYLMQLRLPDVQDQLTVMYVNFGKMQTLTLQPLTLAFLTIFGITLILQFLAMLWHRWATLRHIMAATQLDCSCKKTINSVAEAEEIARELQRTDSTESRAKRRQMSLRERFDRRLTAIGRELEADDDYGNLPARQWHTGHGGRKPTIQARVRRLTAKPRALTKKARLSAAYNASDNV